jgi:hypothetical protein
MLNRTRPTTQPKWQWVRIPTWTFRQAGFWVVRQIVVVRCVVAQADCVDDQLWSASPVSADASISYLCDVGVKAILEINQKLSRSVRLRLGRAGFRFLYSNSAVNADCPIVAICCNDAPLAAKILREHRIVCAVRSGFVRVAFHFYNDESDAIALVHALSKIRETNPSVFMERSNLWKHDECFNYNLNAQ